MMNKELPSQGYVQEEEGVDLSEITHTLMENRWLIFFVTLLFLSMGVFYSLTRIPQYQSDVLLQIEDARHGAGSASGNLASLLDPSGSSENATAIQSALIKSRFILGPVIKENGLDLSVEPKQNVFMRRIWPTSNKATVKHFDSPADTLNQEFTLYYDKPKHFQLLNAEGKLILAGALGEAISLRGFSIEVGSIEGPVGAKFLLKRRADFDIIQSLLQRLTISDLGGKQNTGVLQISLTGADPLMVTHILDSIARVSSNKNVEKKSMEASKTLEFLYEQLPLAKETLNKAEKDLNRYRAKSGKIDIKIQSQALLTKLAELDKQQETLRIDKMNMVQRYTAAHPFMQAIDDQLVGVDLARKKLEKELKSLPDSDQIAVNLMRDVEVKNSLYLILLNKIQELQVVKEGTISDVRILSYAKMPTNPLPVKRGLIYVASAFLGLLFSGLIIFVRKNMSPLVEDPHWIERKFNIVNLAIIPYCKEQAINMVKFQQSPDEGIPLLAHKSPRNLSVESLRSLRTSLQVTLNFSPNNIVSILGIAPGVGKTFISSNLAYLAASSGKRVILIDADLRRGVLNTHFGLEAKPGLGDILTKKASVEEAVREGGHPNLKVLTCGKYPSDPSELLMGDDFKNLIKRFSEEYDIVFIDTAPVLLVTDGVLVGSLAGTNFLVMGANAHQPTEIEMTIKRLTNAGVKLHGTIFNFANQGARGYGYYRYYSYNRYHPYYGRYGRHYGRYKSYSSYYAAPTEKEEASS